MASKSQEPVIGDGSLHVGDRVVYPNQGICRITGVSTKNIAGQNWEVVTLSREEDGATVMVPRAKVMGIGLRKVADVAAIDKVFDDLASPDTNPQLDWKVRHRENADRMTGGGLFGTVEVLKGLHALSRVRPLPQKERELYDSARHLLVGEIAAAMNIPLHVAEDNLDYALWPPPGTKRKGRELPPATLGPPAPVRAAGDDDLGFDDEDLEAEAPAVIGKPAAVEEEDEDEEEKPAPAAKKPAAEKAKASRPPKEKPVAAAAPAHAAHAPAHAPAHPHASAHAHAPAHPHAATRAAAPPKKAAPAKKAPATKKPAAKKATAKKPAVTHAKAKGKR
jgi:CarD family transcriptional regulator, regulator of rRNA transcription